MATIAQLYTDMKHKNAKEVLPHLVQAFLMKWWVESDIFNNVRAIYIFL
jgi:hypothetical protein